MILPSTYEVSKDVDDLYGDQFTVALARAAATLECAPYWHSGEKAPSRLARAQELIRHSRVILQDDRLAIVHGSTKAYDVTGFHCTCPQSQKGQSAWCVHAVAVKLARTMASQAPREAAAVELGTLRAGTLPLPPTTVDARLAQATTDAQDACREAAVALGTMHDQTALQTHHTPQEDRMPDDEYLPEPDDDRVSTAVAEPQNTTAATPRPLPGPVLLPALEPVKIPREYTVNIKGKMHVLYTGLVVAARTHGLTSLSADWTYNDAELSLAHAVCTFADGRRYEESGDATPGNVTKGISLHFRRVALTRAKARCLRDALGISECSVEELADESGKHDVPTMTPPTDQELRQRIWAMMQAQAPDVKTREQAEAWIQQATRYTLRPDNYQQIIVALEARA